MCDDGPTDDVENDIFGAGEWNDNRDEGEVEDDDGCQERLGQESYTKDKEEEDEEFTGLFNTQKAKLLIEAYRTHQKEMNEGRLKKKVVWRKVISNFQLYSTQTKLYFH